MLFASWLHGTGPATVVLVDPGDTVEPDDACLPRSVEQPASAAVPIASQRNTVRRST